MAGVRELLKLGADVNSRDLEGCSALHWAADRGNLEVGFRGLGFAGLRVRFRVADGRPEGVTEK